MSHSGHFLPKRDLESRLNLRDERTDFLCLLWEETGIPHELREHPQWAYSVEKLTD